MGGGGGPEERRGRAGKKKKSNNPTLKGGENKGDKGFWESLVFWLRKNDQKFVFIYFRRHFEFIFESFIFCSTLECFFCRFRAGSGPAPLRSLLEPFSMIFVKNDVLPTWELIFQPELISHAGKTAVFYLKQQGFQLPVFFTVFPFC